MLLPPQLADSGKKLILYETLAQRKLRFSSLFFFSDTGHKFSRVGAIILSSLKLIVCLEKAHLNQNPD